MTACGDAKRSRGLALCVNPARAHAPSAGRTLPMPRPCAADTPASQRPMWLAADVYGAQRRALAQTPARPVALRVGILVELVDVGVVDMKPVRVLVALFRVVRVCGSRVEAIRAARKPAAPSEGAADRECAERDTKCAERAKMARESDACEGAAAMGAGRDVVSGRAGIQMMLSDPEAEVNVGGPAREEDPEVAREEKRKVDMLDGTEFVMLDEGMRVETFIDIAVNCAGL
jgi:hypothetical protein